MAPELLQLEQASTAADCFSLGVLLFAMATGKLPFRKASISDRTYKWLAMGKTEHFKKALNKSCPTEIEPALLDLLIGLWTYNPAKRTTLEEVLSNEWILSEKAQEITVTDLIGSMKAKTCLKYRKNLQSLKFKSKDRSPSF